MLSYHNLSDMEFEYLCEDIMSRRLQTNLRRFGAGKDGGIDLTDSVTEKNIIVQVKHYEKTDAAGLVRSLEKELAKVQKLAPKQFYVCCSKELSPQRVEEIYRLFSDYMDSDANVVTLLEIEDFLTNPDNIDILKKHFKLWISSTNILSELYTNDISIDSEVLIDKIRQDERFFVQTSAYNAALACLEKNRVLFLIGDPGIGKSITSEMLVLYYLNDGYRVRYTTNGTDLSALKRALSADKETREIILLDDCLGQAYFNMKETQENELLSLIRFVNHSSNKKLLLNSRVAIFNEARSHSIELTKCLDRKDLHVYIIDMNGLSALEKAKIFYNHMYFNDIPYECFASIKKDRNYIEVIDHPGYNPRIIDFVCSNKRYSETAPAGYFDYVMYHLDHPEIVWDDEYNRKLLAVDRMLLGTLYSLTETHVDADILKDCFNYRLSLEHGVDKTVNHFNASLERLNGAMIKVVDHRGQKHVSVLNPSVNDYLNARLAKNPLELDELLRTSCSVKQLQRLMTEKAYEERLTQLLESLEILEYHFPSKSAGNGFITYQVCRKRILNEGYAPVIRSYLSAPVTVKVGKNNVTADEVMVLLCDDAIFDFYQLSAQFEDMILHMEFLADFMFPELISVVNGLYPHFQGNEAVVDACIDALKDAGVLYYEDADVRYMDIGYDIHEIVYGNMVVIDGMPELDTAGAADELEVLLRADLRREAAEYFGTLPEAIQKRIDLEKDICAHIYVGGCDSLVESELNADYDGDDDYRGSFRGNGGNYAAIDDIFNR